MSTLYKGVDFKQLFGGTTYDNTGQPTARTSTFIDAEIFSAPWVMEDKTLYMLELDSTNRGGGILAATAEVQRASIPTSYQFPLAAGVIWQPVPGAEITLAAIAAQNIQIAQSIGDRASYVYRLRIHTITSNGDLWAVVVVK